MRVAARVALLLAPAALVRGYICDYRGTGSTTVFPTYVTLPEDCSPPDNAYCNDEFYANFDGGANRWYDPFSKQILTGYDRSTCCTCGADAGAPYNWCQENAPPTGSQDYYLWQTHGCDGYRPDIYYDASAAQAYAPGGWFTDPDQLANYIQNTVKCEDDCDVGEVQDENPTPATTCTSANPGCCGYQIAENCDNTAITLTSTDACGNTNTAGPYYVRYDPDPPIVEVQVPPFSSNKYKYKWEKLPVSVNITEDCTLHPLTSIQIYSDEVGLLKDNQQAAVLERQYDITGLEPVVNGWDAILYRAKQATKSCSTTDFACHAANGRFYTIRVCAQDLAGHVDCDEKWVGVPPRGYSPASKHLWTPTYDGKLFLVAEDLVYWEQTPFGMAVPELNTGLDA